MGNYIVINKLIIKNLGGIISFESHYLIYINNNVYYLYVFTNKS